MKSTVIVPFGQNTAGVFVGLREIPTEKVVLLHAKEQAKAVEALGKDLNRFKVPWEGYSVRELHSLEEVFEAVHAIKEREEGRRLMINLGCAEKGATCTALSAAYVNGITAFDVMGDQVIVMPVLRFNYYTLLSEKKLAMLKFIHEHAELESLEELANQTRTSLPLVSYHIRGSRKSEGLQQMGLVEVEERKGRLKVRASPLGRLLLKGYVQPPPSKVS